MFKNKKTKKGASLVEVIIVLAIVSLTIVSSMSLVARTRIEIKNNEIEDKISDILLKAMEAMKKPGEVVLTGATTFTPGRGYYFSLKQDLTGVYSLELQRFASPLPTQSGTFQFSDVCTPNNPFYLTDSKNFNYCQQVEITQIQSAVIPNEQLYKITTTLIYGLSGQSKSETLVTYRYEGFK